MKAFITKKRILTVASIVLMLVIWKVLALAFNTPSIIPHPETTFLSVFRIFAEPGFLAVVGSTVLRGVTGFIISGILGILTGILAGISPGFNTFITPMLVSVRSIPVVSLILLALIWFNAGAVPVFVAFPTMFPFICTNVSDGIRSVDPGLVEMARFYRVDKGRILTGVYIPAIMPFIISGSSSAMGIGWRAIIIGEVLSQPLYGIGTRLQTAQSFLNIETVIAWTLIAVAISFIFEKLIRWGELHIIRWQTGS